MIKVGLCYPDRHDSGQYWRASWPLNKLRKLIPGFYTEEIQDLTYWGVGRYDVLFFFRPPTAGCVAMMEMAKVARVPIVSDFDDNLFAITPDNPSSMNYNHDDIRKSVAECIRLSDVVTVSTQYLKDCISEHNDNIVVVPNAIEDSVWETRAKKNQGKKIISWRGGPAHQGDIVKYMNQMAKIHEKYSDFVYALYGGENFWQLLEKLDPKRTVNFNLKDVFSFINSLRDSKAFIHLVPLMDTVFNRCKSNISWIEGTMSGAAVVAPDFEEWQDEGIIRYDPKEPREFYDAVKSLIETPDMAMIANLQSQKVIEEKYLLSVVNKKRVDVFCAALNGTKVEPQKLKEVPHDYEELKESARV